jgi:hypothetical protein
VCVCACVRVKSVMSLCFMAVAVAIFAIGAGGFLADVQKFVIAPVERISALTSNLSDTLAFLAPNAGSVKSQTGQGGGDGTAAAGGGEDEDEDEVKRLGDQVQKMLELLQIGFGEAGSKIIEQNLSKGTEELQPMMPGQYVDEIFVGFIMLENFDAVTDVMEADIMLCALLTPSFRVRCVLCGVSVSRTPPFLVVATARGLAEQNSSFRFRGGCLSPADVTGTPTISASSCTTAWCRQGATRTRTWGVPFFACGRGPTVPPGASSRS